MKFKELNLRKLDKAQKLLRKTEMLLDEKKDIKAHKDYVLALHTIYKTTNKSFGEKEFEEEYLSKGDEQPSAAIVFADNLIQQMEKTINVK